MCRQIHQEANHLFFAQNPFHLNTAHILRGFLESLGQIRRNGLTILYLDSLLTPEPNWTEEDCVELASETSLTIGQDAKEASRLLGKCKNLRKIYLEVRFCEDPIYISFLTGMYGYEDAEIHFRDFTRWSLMQSECYHSRFNALHLQLGENNGHVTVFGGEGDRAFEVNIMNAIKQKLTKMV